MPTINYNIDKLASYQDDCLVIKPLVDGKPQSLQVTAWLNLGTSSHEKELLQRLIKEEELYCRSKTKKTNPLTDHFHIPFSKTEELLKLLAGSGKFTFNQKPIYCDFFGKVEANFSVKEADESVHISIQIQDKNQVFLLTECDFVCSGVSSWIIKNGFLKFIQTDISWKWLKKGLTEWMFSKSDYHKLVDDAVDPNDPQSPKIIALTENKKNVSSPFPLLKLKDRTGAFADLWMDYGHGQQVAYHDQTKSFKRESKEEQAWEKDLLETGFIKKFVENAHYFCALDKVSKSLTFLLDLGWTILDHKEKKLIRMGDASLEMDHSSHAILVKGKVHFDSYTADLKDVCGAFSRREKFISLANGTTGLLPEQSEASSLFSLAEDGEVVAEGVRLKKHHLGLLGDLFKSSSVTYDLDIAKIRDRLTDFKGVESFLPGSQFKGVLRPYQQQGLDWLKFLYDWGFHGLLADDMGLGKTVQALAFLSLLSSKMPHLIVLPSSLLFNWKCEIQRFLPDTTYLVHQGPNRLTDIETLKEFQIILTSYATLRQDLPLLNALNYECVILDEAQYIKNHSTMTAQAVCQLQSNFRIAITGTPIENHLGELWSHFHFLMPDFLGTQEEFTAQIQAAQSDSRHLMRLQKKIRPFMLRRTKKEVAPDLPERIDQVLMIDLSSSQRQIYDDYLAGVRSNLLKKVESEGLSKHRIEILEAILRLRQICCHPALISSQLNEQTAIESTKLDLLLNDLEQVLNEGSKALIYSQFTSMLHLIAKAMQERGWSYVMLDGTTQKREEIVNAFQNDKKLPFFLISLKAGGVGLNLTAADYVFLFEPWWNESVENQAIDRAHRIGREKTVIAKRLVSSETIEERMMSLKLKKRQLSEELLEGSLNNSSLSEADLQFLLT